MKKLIARIITIIMSVLCTLNTVAATDYQDANSPPETETTRIVEEETTTEENKIEIVEEETTQPQEGNPKGRIAEPPAEETTKAQEEKKEEPTTEAAPAEETTKNTNVGDVNVPDGNEEETPNDNVAADIGENIEAGDTTETQSAADSLRDLIAVFGQIGQEIFNWRAI